jgi:hypothetical protein
MNGKFSKSRILHRHAQNQYVPPPPQVLTIITHQARDPQAKPMLQNLIITMSYC